MQEENLGIIIGTVLKAEKIQGTERLHKIVVDVGEGKTAQIASGIAGDFGEGYLIGKQVPICINVKPIKIRGILSEARFLATSDANGTSILLNPEKKVPAGSKVW